MNKPDQVANAAAHRIGNGLKPFLLKHLIQQLGGNALLRERAERLLKLLHQDTNNELNLRPLDLFLPDHLSTDEITEAAKERSIDKEEGRPHLKTCTMCNAFVETEAAQLIVRKSLEPDVEDVMFGLESKIPEAPTDNQKWFGKTPGSRI